MVVTEGKGHSDDPKILFKYVPDERALTCLPELGSGTLRATQPAALNDPFECHQKLDVFFAGSDHNTRLAQGLTELHERVPVTSDDVADARRRYGSLYVRDLLTRQLSQRFGIVSFSALPFHPLMWSYYTADGSGFVIGYKTARLRQLHGTRLHKVQYSSEPGVWLHYDVNPATDPYAILSQKGSHWEYEHEWRLIVELYQTVGLGKTDRHGQPINLLHVPNSAVAKVYYTERTPAESVNEIQRRLGSANNRYGTQHATKLMLSAWTYEYAEAGTEAPTASAQQLDAALQGLLGDPAPADR